MAKLKPFRFILIITFSFTLLFILLHYLTHVDDDLVLYYHQHHENEQQREKMTKLSTTTTTTTPVVEEDQRQHETQTEKSKVEITKLLKWNRSVYLPVPPESIAAFKKYEDRQRDRLSLNLWKSGIKKDSAEEADCLRETPECEFFRIIKAPILFDKCCSEHLKMKTALEYTVRVAETTGLRFFLDSGTLLSFARDGGDTLVPWETDIDLGIVGAWPVKVDSSFKKFKNENEHRIHRHRYFESCKRKKSANKSRDGTCSDAFYVYFATNEKDSQHDTSRVEIWPFREDGEMLIHPTRKKLSVHRDIVLPLKRCWDLFPEKKKMKKHHSFWGILNKLFEDDEVLLCPAKTEEYLDHEYGPTWRWPKTIHWGQNNAPAWNSGKKLT